MTTVTSVKIRTQKNTPYSIAIEIAKHMWALNELHLILTPQNIIGTMLEGKVVPKMVRSNMKTKEKK